MREFHALSAVHALSLLHDLILEPYLALFVIVGHLLSAFGLLDRLEAFGSYDFFVYCLGLLLRKELKELSEEFDKDYFFLIIPGECN